MFSLWNRNVYLRSNTKHENISSRTQDIYTIIFNIWENLHSLFLFKLQQYQVFQGRSKTPSKQANL